MIIDCIVGNVNDEIWEKKLSTALIDYVTLNQWEAQKNRFKRQSGQGVEVAVSLDRGDYLHDGDILVWDEKNNSAIVVHIHLKKVMVIYLDDLLNEEPEKMLQTAIELGHALGNQHWPAVYKDKKVYVPMTLDEKAMSSVMRTHDFQGIRFEFIPGSEVIPFISPHESRRLFGGAEGPVHVHTHS